MAYKIAVVLLSLLASSWSAIIRPKIIDDHNIEQCDGYSSRDTSVLLTNVYSDAAFLSFVERMIYVPETGELDTPITCIKILNLDSSIHGGYPQIVSGGIGSKHVQIELKSQWIQPLNFRIEIYREHHH